MATITRPSPTAPVGASDGPDSPDTPDATGRTIFNTWGLFSALGLLMLGNGLLGTLLGIRSVLEGFSTVTSGVILAVYYVGFLAGSRYAVTAAVRVGHVRVFAALASLASVSALLHVVWVTPVAWGALRFVSGFATAGLYVVAEGWLNGLATNGSRGRLMSVYMVVIMGGLAASQLLLYAGDPGQYQLFILSSVLVSVAVVPVSLSVGTAPRLDAVPDALKMRELWEIAPLGLVGALLVGMANGGFTSIAPVYASASGMSSSRVAVFMTIALFGAVAMQFPIGYLSDRMYRRQTILLVASLLVGLTLVASMLDAADTAMLPVVFLVGGLMFPMYSLVASHVSDVVPAERALAAAVAMVFYSGVGAVLGPLVLSLAMQLTSVGSFFVTLAVINGAIALFALGRMATEQAVPIDRQRPWRALTRRSVVLAGTRLPRRRGTTAAAPE